MRLGGAIGFGPRAAVFYIGLEDPNGDKRCDGDGRKGRRGRHEGLQLPLGELISVASDVSERGTHRHCDPTHTGEDIGPSPHADIGVVHLHEQRGGRYALGVAIDPIRFDGAAAEGDFNRLVRSG